MAFYKSPTKGDEGSAGGPVALSQEDRIAALIEEAQRRAPPQVAELLKSAGPILVPVVNVAITFFNFVAPLYFKLGKAIYAFLTMCAPRMRTLGPRERAKRHDRCGLDRRRPWTPARMPACATPWTAGSRGISSRPRWGSGCASSVAATARRSPRAKPLP